MTKTKDPEIAEFEEALLRSVDDMTRGKYARVHTPEQIMARRRGRPVGSKQAVTKAPVKLRLDPEIVETFRASGAGWQTRMNAALADWLKTNSPEELSV
jgi:uncharacterized protein (DUF4415 family)